MNKETSSPARNPSVYRMAPGPEEPLAVAAGGSQTRPWCWIILYMYVRYWRMAVALETRLILGRVCAEIAGDISSTSYLPSFYR